ncbi:MAG: hypothetical protein ABT22_02405 [Thiobacillus sp. SCN 64-317]|nr:hypothetical protein [Thiobacillus sp.]MBN8766902.1 hypothetical protein [Thiobacillus sp.]ODV13827.1 MAG: hypothetical protein ABT22_02405 [Thiobacillus sp. SCN 64-317]
MKAELTPAMQRRLAKLAAAAGRTPDEMLPYVMQDGFEYTEDFVRKVNEAIAEADSGDGTPHEVVMQEVQAIIDAHAAKRKKAA